MIKLKIIYRTTIKNQKNKIIFYPNYLKPKWIKRKAISKTSCIVENINTYGV